MIHISTSRATAIRILFLIFAWLQPLDSVIARNITIQDTSPALVYSPPSAWYSSSEPCFFCLKPDSQTSYHEGVNFVAPQDTSLSDATGRNDYLEHATWVGRWKKRRSPLESAESEQELDALDLTLSFEFTGTAVYVFAIRPLGQASPNGPSTNTNLSFSLNNRLVGSYSAIGSPSRSDFLPDTPVLSISSLEPIKHRLVIRVGQNSTFLFDRLVYTSILSNRWSQASTTSELSSTVTDSTTPLAQASSNPNITPESKKHSVTTFAIAVGCSVGVLTFFSAALAISIIRRRRRSRLRERIQRSDHHEAAQLHTDSSDDSPMMGPTPFIPRYFPGTVILPQQEQFVAQPHRQQRLDDLPSDHPPDYSSAVAEMVAAGPRSTAATLASNRRRHHRNQSEDESYADMPPTTPPPPPGLVDDNETNMSIPPPPFPEHLGVPELPPSISRQTSRASVIADPPRVIRSSSNRGLTSSNHDLSRSRSRSSGRLVDRPPNTAVDVR